MIFFTPTKYMCKLKKKFEYLGIFLKKILSIYVNVLNYENMGSNL